MNGLYYPIPQLGTIMAKKNKISYICNECGHSVAKWQGKCGKCQAWNSFEEQQSTLDRPGTKSVSNFRKLNPIKLQEIDLSA